MFTLEQVTKIHDEYGNHATLPQYVDALAAIGVRRTDTLLIDGHTIYSAADGYSVSTPKLHKSLDIAAVSDRESLLEHLRTHRTGQTSYLQMSEGFASSGIERWTFDIPDRTVTYYDKSGSAVFVEPID